MGTVGSGVPLQPAQVGVASRAPSRGSLARTLVLVDLGKSGVDELLRDLLPWLRGRGTQVDLESDVREFCRRRAELDPAAAARDVPELIVVLGGDGAILGAVRAFADHPVPTLGINFGRVGFLASTPASRWRDVLEGIYAGEGVLEPRMRFEAHLTRGDRSSSVRAVALNDVVTQRGAAQGMLTLGLSVDGTWVTDYRADGLIVATPSGSTAHSLSAGGPVLAPSMNAIVVTPVCPQGLSYRPIVLSPDSRVEVSVLESSGITSAAVDGQGFFPLRAGDSVRVARHPIAYPLLGWSELDPYRRLRERLGWSGRQSPESSRAGAEPRATDDGERGVL